MQKPLILTSAFAAALAAASAVEAVPIPLPGATAVASTQGGTSISNEPTFASASNTAGDPDFAEARAEATVGGSVRAGSQVDAASGVFAPSHASANASWIGNFTTGGTDPGADIDIAFNLSVDGFLSYFNNNSGAGPDDIVASMELDVVAHAGSGPHTLFDGDAAIRSVTNDAPPDFTFFGFSAGDFSGACSRFDCGQTLDASIGLSPLLVGFGSVFAIELSLMTDAFGFAGFEVFAESNFFDTVGIELSTTTPGVVIEQIGGPSPGVPEPGTLPLLVGALVLAARRRR